jgi:hypothetical protein
MLAANKQESFATSPLMRKSSLGSATEEFQGNQHVEWSTHLENVTKTLGEHAQGFKLMHIQSARKNQYRYNAIMYASLFVGPLASVVSGIGITQNPPDTPAFYPVIASVISFFAGLLTMVIKFGKFDQSSSAHKLAASRYTSLESNVRRQLDLPRNIRVEAVNYLAWLHASYDEVFVTSPLIPVSIVRSYSAHAAKTGAPVPPEQEVIININTDYEKTNIQELGNVLEINVNESNSEKQQSESKEHCDTHQPIQEEDGFEKRSDTNLVRGASKRDVRNSVTFKQAENKVPRTPRNQESIRGDTPAKRHDINSFQDFGKFRDGMMDYELKRLFKNG